MMETPGFRSGKCIQGVSSSPSSHGEVYMPDHGGDDAQEDDEDKDDKGQDQQIQNEETGKEEYEALRQAVREGSPVVSWASEEALLRQDQAARDVWLSSLRGSAVAGFQQAMRAGPLCEEPVFGVLVVLDGLEVVMRRIEEGNEEEERSKLDAANSLAGGMMVSALTSGIRCAMLTRPVRLVEGHLRLTLHSSLEGQGSLYAVLSKRRGKVISDDMVEGTDLLAVIASLPQAESFGLAPELLKKSSGQVTTPLHVNIMVADALQTWNVETESD